MHQFSVPDKPDISMRFPHRTADIVVSFHLEVEVDRGILRHDRRRPVTATRIVRPHRVRRPDRSPRSAGKPSYRHKSTVDDTRLLLIDVDVVRGSLLKASTDIQRQGAVPAAWVDHVAGR